MNRGRGHTCFLNTDLPKLGREIYYLNIQKKYKKIYNGHYFKVFFNIVYINMSGLESNNTKTFTLMVVVQNVMTVKVKALLQIQK